MKKIKENSTVNYNPEQISDRVVINFTKCVNGGARTISGSIRKDGTECGTVSYDSNGNYLITSVKPHTSLTEEEIAAVYHSVPGCIIEMLSDE